MGLYNDLILEDYVCPECGARRRAVVQFKYGNKRLHEYSIGDQLVWMRNANDNGEPGREPGRKRVIARGVADGCAGCPDPAEFEYFDITICEDRILDIQPASDDKHPGLADGRVYWVAET